ncbi:MAG: hypothetical protein SOT28_04685 [Fusicatenibacter sp.]|nr:hypothetical protein [Lachnospiraceae bacterium]MDY2937599.1 hypothetical protein [Fusicatenibacter sp.]
MKLPDHFQKRVAMTTFGVLFCAIAVGFFKCSLFGVDPFQCFAQGIWGGFFQNVASYGVYYMILSGIMLVLDLFIARSYMGIATLVNMFLTGYLVDFTCLVIRHFCPAPGLGIRVLFLAIAVLVMCFASSLYMTSNLGVSVYDAIPIVLSNKSKIPFRFVRITCDLICVIIGAISGLMPGIGTLITAFFMGPLIEYFNRHFSEPFLFGNESSAN